MLLDGAWAGKYKVELSVFANVLEPRKCSLLIFSYKGGYTDPDSLPIDSSANVNVSDSEQLLMKLEMDSLHVVGARSGHAHAIVDMDSSGQVYAISCMVGEEDASGYPSLEDVEAHNREVDKFQIKATLTFSYLGSLKKI